MVVTPFDFVYFAGSFIATLVCLVVVLYRGNRHCNAFLAIGLFSLGYVLLSFFLIETRLLLRVPHLYRTGSLMGFLFWPAFYLYVRQSVAPSRLTWRDAVHLLPFVLFAADYGPVFLYAAEEKRRMFLTKTYAEYIVGLDEGWLVTPRTYVWLRLGQIGVYWGGQVYLVWGWFRASRGAKAPTWARSWLRWFGLLLVMQSILACAGLVIASGSALDAHRIWFMVAIGLMSLAMTFALLLQPHLLHGLRGHTHPGPVKVPARSSPERAFDDALHDQLTTLMQEQQPFLKTGYSLPDLSADMGLPVHQVSNHINQRYGMNFNEYINRHRVEHFKNRLQRHDWQHLTLEALARESGFSNRFTFTNAFKRTTGMTPTDYLRSQRRAS